MNKIFGGKGIKIVSAVAFCILAGQFTFAASTIKASSTFPAVTTTLVYERNANPTIGITPQANAVGYSFSIIDEKGKVVKTGIIKSNKTFYVATKKLKDGKYRFNIGNQQLQAFQVK